MRRTTAQSFALIFGIIYVLIGVLGFPVTGFSDFAGKTYEEELLIFPVNPLHNLVHLVLGVWWVASSGRHATANQANLVIGGVLGLVTILGGFGVLRFLAIESFGSPDNFLHLVTAALSLYFGTAGAETTEGSPAV